MPERIIRTTIYRGLNIATNPSGEENDARTDAFLIMQPSGNPMYTDILHEHPRHLIATYDTEDAAREAALAQARAWIDSHLGPAAD